MRYCDNIDRKIRKIINTTIRNAYSINYTADKTVEKLNDALIKKGFDFSNDVVEALKEFNTQFTIDNDIEAKISNEDIDTAISKYYTVTDDIVDVTDSDYFDDPEYVEKVIQENKQYTKSEFKGLEDLFKYRFKNSNSFEEFFNKKFKIDLINLTQIDFLVGNTVNDLTNNSPIEFDKRVKKFRVNKLLNLLRKYTDVNLDDIPELNIEFLIEKVAPVFGDLTNESILNLLDGGNLETLNDYCDFISAADFNTIIGSYAGFKSIIKLDKRNAVYKKAKTKRIADGWQEKETDVNIAESGNELYKLLIETTPLLTSDKSKSDGFLNVAKFGYIVDKINNHPNRTRLDDYSEIKSILEDFMSTGLYKPGNIKISDYDMSYIRSIYRRIFESDPTLGYRDINNNPYLALSEISGTESIMNVFLTMVNSTVKKDLLTTTLSFGETSNSFKVRDSDSLVASMANNVENTLSRLGNKFESLSKLEDENDLIKVSDKLTVDIASKKIVNDLDIEGKLFFINLLSGLNIDSEFINKYLINERNLTDKNIDRFLNNSIVDLVTYGTYLSRLKTTARIVESYNDGTSLYTEMDVNESVKKLNRAASKVKHGGAYTKETVLTREEPISILNNKISNLLEDVSKFINIRSNSKAESTTFNAQGNRTARLTLQTPSDSLRIRLNLLRKKFENEGNSENVFELNPFLSDTDNFFKVHASDGVKVNDKGFKQAKINAQDSMFVEVFSNFLTQLKDTAGGYYSITPMVNSDKNRENAVTVKNAGMFSLGLEAGKVTNRTINNLKEKHKNYLSDYYTKITNKLINDLSKVNEFISLNTDYSDILEFSNDLININSNHSNPLQKTLENISRVFNNAGVDNFLFNVHLSYDKKLKTFKPLNGQLELFSKIINNELNNEYAFKYMPNFDINGQDVYDIIRSEKPDNHYDYYMRYNELCFLKLLIDNNFSTDNQKTITSFLTTEDVEIFRESYINKYTKKEEFKDKIHHNYELNPALKMFFYSWNYLSDSYSDISQGNPFQYNKSTMFDNYTANVKRNNTETASFYPYTLNIKGGLRDNIKTVTMFDIEENMLTADGNEGSFEIFDGAGFSLETTRISSQISLGGSQGVEGGITHKMITRSHIDEYALLDQEKLADFTITAEKIRNSIGSKVDLSKFVKKAYTHKNFDEEVVLSDEFIDKVNSSKLYVKNGKEITPVILEKGKGYNNLYEIYEDLGLYNTVKIDSNGYIKSGIEGDNSTYSYTSIEDSNHSAVFLHEVIHDLNYADHIERITQTSTRKTITVNPMTSDSLFDDDTSLLHSTMNLKDSGIQLNKTKDKLNNTEIALPTQIITSTSFGGFTPEKSRKLIQTLKKLSLTSIDSEFKNIDDVSASDIETIKNKVIKLTLASIEKRDTGSLAKEILSFKTSSGDYAFDNNQLFSKLISVLNAHFTSNGIRDKVSGVDLIVTPNTTQVYDVMINGEITQVTRENLEDDDVQTSWKIEELSDIVYNGYYKVVNEDGSEQLIDKPITSSEEKLALFELMQSGKEIHRYSKGRYLNSQYFRWFEKQPDGQLLEMTIYDTDEFKELKQAVDSGDKQAENFKRGALENLTIILSNKFNNPDSDDNIYPEYHDKHGIEVINVENIPAEIGMYPVDNDKFNIKTGQPLHTVNVDHFINNFYEGKNTDLLLKEMGAELFKKDELSFDFIQIAESIAKQSKILKDLGIYDKKKENKIISKYANTIESYIYDYLDNELDDEGVMLVKKALMPDADDDIIKDIDESFFDSELENLSAYSVYDILKTQLKLVSRKIEKENTNSKEELDETIRSIAEKQFESFKDSLYGMTSRTPGQSLASTSLSKVVFFKHTEKNSIEASKKDSYIKGEDHDIDVKGLVKKTVNKNGFIINKDNIENLKDTNDVKELKNNLTHLLFDIIGDPANTIQKETAISTAEVNELANKYGKDEKTKTYTRNNPMVRAIMKEQNHIGKDSISSFASSLKALQAIYDYFLGKGNNEIFFENYNGGLPSDLPTNSDYGLVYIKHITNESDEEKLRRIQDKLEEIIYKSGENVEGILDEDAEAINDILGYKLGTKSYDIIGQLLNASLDNAKVLLLDKINIDTANASVMAYGVIFNNSLEDMVKIFSDPVVKYANKISKTSIFGESGMSLDNQYKNLKKEADSFFKIAKALYNNKSRLSEEHINLLENGDLYGENFEEFIAIAEEFTNTKYTKTDITSIKTAKKFLDNTNYYNKKRKINFKNIFIYDNKYYSLSDLDYKEIIKTDNDEIRTSYVGIGTIDEDSNLSKYVSLNSKAEAFNALVSAFSINQGVKNSAADYFNYLSKVQKKLNSSTIPGVDSRNIDIIRFIRDKEYRTYAIEETQGLYPDFNPFAVLANTEHMMTYLENMMTTLLVSEKISSKVNVLSGIVSKYSDEALSSDYLNTILKNTDKYMSLGAVQKITGEDPIKVDPFTLSVGDEEISVVNFNFTTAEGISNFMMWMNDIVIPEAIDSNKSNEFLRHLTLDKDKEGRRVYKVYTDSMDMDDSRKKILEESLKISLEKLQSNNEFSSNYSLNSLLRIYTLLAHSDSMNKYSLTKYFKDNEINRKIWEYQASKRLNETERDFIEVISIVNKTRNSYTSESGYEYKENVYRPIAKNSKTIKYKSKLYGRFSNKTITTDTSDFIYDVDVISNLDDNSVDGELDALDYMENKKITYTSLQEERVRRIEKINKEKQEELESNNEIVTQAMIIRTSAHYKKLEDIINLNSSSSVKFNVRLKKNGFKKSKKFGFNTIKSNVIINQTKKGNLNINLALSHKYETIIRDILSNNALYRKGEITRDDINNLKGYDIEELINYVEQDLVGIIENDTTISEEQKKELEHIITERLLEESVIENITEEFNNFVKTGKVDLPDTSFKEVDKKDKGIDSDQEEALDSLIRAENSKESREMFVKSKKADIAVLNELTSRLEDLNPDIKFELVSDQELGNNRASVVSHEDGKHTVYINTDKASLADPIHELGHVLLAIVKSENEELYNNLIEKAKTSRFFNSVSSLYRDKSEKEILEEVFVTELGEVTNKKISGKNSWYNSFRELLREFIRSFKSGLNKIGFNFSLSEDVISEDILSKSFNNIINNFGDKILTQKLSKIKVEKRKVKTYDVVNTQNKVITKQADITKLSREESKILDEVMFNLVCDI